MKWTIQIFRQLILASSAITITACSIFSPVTLKQPTEYALTQVPAARVSRDQSPLILFVMTPNPGPYYRTTQMTYELKPHQISYYTRNAWAEPPAQMLQPLLVKTLQNTRRFSAIVEPPVTGNYNYMLTTHILKLRANYDIYPAAYEVTLRVQIFNAASNNAIATKDISIRETIHGCEFYNGVLAANHAVAKALDQVSRFTLHVVK